MPTNFVFTLVCALHWFNPAAHIALRRWAQCREEAADEAAILWLGQASSVDYGETLLHVLRQTTEQPAAPVLTLSIVESFSQLRKRLTMIKHYERRSPHLLFTGTIFVAAALGILLRPVRAQNAPAQTAAQPAVIDAKPALAWQALDQRDPTDRLALITEFKKRGYTIPDSFVDERIDSIVATNFHGDRDAFSRDLDANGSSLTKLREAEREKIMVQAMFYELMKEAQTAKAKALIVPKIKVTSLPLADAIQILASAVSHLVPKGQGMDVQIDPQAPQAFKDTVVTLNLSNVSLADVLQSIAAQTNGKVVFNRRGIGIMPKPLEE